jgi:hypothetical protein
VRRITGPFRKVDGCGETFRSPPRKVLATKRAYESAQGNGRKAAGVCKGVTTMVLLSIIHELPQRVRRLMAPRYRPEKHYMRGFGPASAARRAASHG